MNKRNLIIVGSIVVVLVMAIVVMTGAGIVYAAAQVGSDVISAATRAGKIALRQVVGEKAEVEEPGVVMASVVPDSPAAKAGLARGDILLELNGQEINTPAELQRAVGTLEPGDGVELLVHHGDEERTLKATVGERNGKPFLGLTPCGGLGTRVTVVAELRGAIVSRVMPDSPAEKAGLKEGDVIAAVGAQVVGPENDLASLIAAYKPGDTVVLKVTRPGQEPREMTVELGEHPDKEGTAYLGVQCLSLSRWDASDGKRLPFSPPSGAAPFAGLKRGVVVREVIKGGPADEAGLQAGDVITATDHEPLETPQDLSDAIAAHQPGDKLSLTIYRSGKEIELQVTLGDNPDKAGTAYLGMRIGSFFRLDRFENEDAPPWSRLDKFFEGGLPHFEFAPGEDRSLPHFDFRGLPDDLDCCQDTL
jgi:S1-C subfamily serine protease